MKRLALASQAPSTETNPPPSKQKRIVSLASVQPTSVNLRDGEVVVYRRSRSLLYQCRYKLSDGTWHRQTTGKASLEHAIARACDIYAENIFNSNCIPLCMNDCDEGTCVSTSSR